MRGTHTHTQSASVSVSLPPSLSLSLSVSVSLCLSLPLSLPLSLAHTHTHTLSLHSVLRVAPSGRRCAGTGQSPAPCRHLLSCSEKTRGERTGLGHARKITRASSHVRERAHAQQQEQQQQQQQRRGSIRTCSFARLTSMTTNVMRSSPPMTPNTTPMINGTWSATREWGFTSNA